MPEAAIENLTRGLPVEIGKIDRELKQLWKQGEGAATRASLINFAVYCEGAAAMDDSTQIISQLTRDHACRAILIGMEPNAVEKRVQAWISAHCHISRAGAKQVCCEQITFLIEGNSRELIPNIVFSHLDSDLPLYLWWRGEFPEPPGEQLWKWVDRLIYDSQRWPEPRRQLGLLRNQIAASTPRLTLRDLNWTRSLYLRQAMARLADHPENYAQLERIERITITHAPRARLTAALLAGWLAAQLRWKIAYMRGNNGRIVRGENKPDVALEFVENPQAQSSISEMVLAAPDAQLRIGYESGSDFLHADARLPDGHEFRHLMPPGADATLALLSEELNRASTHEIYLRALSAAEPLL